VSCQGDPISPYLFLLISEGLSMLLQQAQQSKQISGIKICRRAFEITHLLFADDAIIFCKANSAEASVLRDILQKYEALSGQKINLQKSHVLFSRNVEPTRRTEICDILGILEGENLGFYLGLPTQIGR